MAKTIAKNEKSINLIIEKNTKKNNAAENSSSENNNSNKTNKSDKLLVVRVRGAINTPHYVKLTLRFIRLHKNNYCTILPKTSSAEGMLQKAKDCVTWGEAEPETIKALTEKYGEQKYYRLNPPKKGYGRKGIKTPFSKSGALGYRGQKINDLVLRMI